VRVRIDLDQGLSLGRWGTMSQTQGGEKGMPFNAMMVSFAVVGIFILFGAALLWADSQTRHRV
jgi:hypothetical protein